MPGSLFREMLDTFQLFKPVVAHNMSPGAHNLSSLLTVKHLCSKFTWKETVSYKLKFLWKEALSLL